MRPLVSKVSMVTVFWAVTYYWRTLGKQSKHGHLFLRGRSYIYVVTIFTLQISSRFYIFNKMTPLVGIVSVVTVIRGDHF